MVEFNPVSDLKRAQAVKLKVDQLNYHLLSYLRLHLRTSFEDERYAERQAVDY